MLKELKINNFVLVKEMIINFKDNLTVMTGETGAGKSVIAGAVHLVLGEQLKSDIFYDQNQSVVLEATFDIKEHRQNEYFTELINKYELELDDSDLFFTREVKPDGKSSIFINGRKVTNSTVKEFSAILLDFHSQRDQQTLFNDDVQLFYLDNYADIIEVRNEFGETFSKWSELLKSLKKYQDDKKSNEEKMMLYQYQINELESANLNPDEESTLDSEHNLLINAKEILDIFLILRADLFENDNSVSDSLIYYQKRMENYADDSKIIRDTLENLITCNTALADINQNIRKIDSEIAVDEARLAEVEARVKTLYELKTKYKKNIPELIDYIVQMKNFVLNYQTSEETELALIQQIKVLQEKCFELANKLHFERENAAKNFEKEIIDSLRKLAINDADFKICIENINNSDEKLTFENYNQTGFDKVKYLFSANRGTVMQDMKSTISGGELSRLLLVIKSILAKKLPERTIIFDEIDVGIGGQTAKMLGEFIKTLSQKHQILSITHLPQIAAIADQHLKIEKLNQNDKTVITLKQLLFDERKNEIARMLAGNITQVALDHAQELLFPK